MSGSSLFGSFIAWVQSCGDQVFWLIAWATTFLGLFLYYRIYRILPDRSGFFGEIPRLIAGVSASTVKARQHIWAGAFLFAGLSLIVGMGTADFFPDHADIRSFKSTNAGLVLGILTLFLALWTLYQTKRLERLQGEGIKGFDTLVGAVRKEIDSLIQRWDDSRDRSSDVFRLYMITNNPYFGVNSYPGKPVSLDYASSLKKLAERVKTQRLKTKENEFKFRIICADKVTIDIFNANYEDRGTYDKATRNQESEALIQDLIEFLGDDAFYRLPHVIPAVQFIVVGDVVFEFILESPDSKASRARGSDIIHTTRIDDRLVAERFERYIEFLGAVLGSTGVQHSDVPKGPGG
jgi:hypothetical protein